MRKQTYISSKCHEVRSWEVDTDIVVQLLFKRHLTVLRKSKGNKMIEGCEVGSRTTGMLLQPQIKIEGLHEYQAAVHHG